MYTFNELKNMLENFNRKLTLYGGLNEKKLGVKK